MDPTESKVYLQVQKILFSPGLCFDCTELYFYLSDLSTEIEAANPQPTDQIARANNEIFSFSSLPIVCQQKLSRSFSEEQQSAVLSHIDHIYSDYSELHQLLEKSEKHMQDLKDPLPDTIFDNFLWFQRKALKIRIIIDDLYNDFMELTSCMCYQLLPSEIVRKFELPAPLTQNQPNRWLKELQHYNSYSCTLLENLRTFINISYKHQLPDINGNFQVSQQSFQTTIANDDLSNVYCLCPLPGHNEQITAESAGNIAAKILQCSALDGFPSLIRTGSLIYCQHEIEGCLVSSDIKKARLEAKKYYSNIAKTNLLLCLIASALKLSNSDIEKFASLGESSAVLLIIHSDLLSSKQTLIFKGLVDILKKREINHIILHDNIGASVDLACMLRQISRKSGAMAHHSDPLSQVITDETPGDRPVIPTNASSDEIILICATYFYYYLTAEFYQFDGSLLNLVNENCPNYHLGDIPSVLRNCFQEMLKALLIHKHRNLPASWESAFKNTALLKPIRQHKNSSSKQRTARSWFVGDTKKHNNNRLNHRSRNTAILTALGKAAQQYLQTGKKPKNETIRKSIRFHSDKLNALEKKCLSGTTAPCPETGMPKKTTANQPPWQTGKKTPEKPIKITQEQRMTIPSEDLKKCLSENPRHYKQSRSTGEKA